MISEQQPARYGWLIFLQVLAFFCAPAYGIQIETSVSCSRLVALINKTTYANNYRELELWEVERIEERAAHYSDLPRDIGIRESMLPVFRQPIRFELWKPSLQSRIIDLETQIADLPIFYNEAIENTFIAMHTGYGSLVPKDRESVDQNWKTARTKVDEWIEQKLDLSVERLIYLSRILGENLSPDTSREGKFGELRNIELFGATKKGRLQFVAAADVEALLEDFVAWYAKASTLLHPAELAARAAMRLASIHPMTDGNGRLLRLVCFYWILKQFDWPPALLAHQELRVAAFGSPNPSGEPHVQNSIDHILLYVLNGVHESIRLLKN